MDTDKHRFRQRDPWRTWRITRSPYSVGTTAVSNRLQLDPSVLICGLCSRSPAQGVTSLIRKNPAVAPVGTSTELIAPVLTTGLPKAVHAAVRLGADTN